MEEQIIVFSKKWFKKHNKTLCWFANTPIIKYWFRWLLRIHNDISWNERINEITPNAFTYGKKLILTEDGLRWKQTTDFRTHEKFGKRLYYGLKPLWYLLHFWDWATAMQPKLNLGFDTLTVYPDAGTGGDTVDGTVTMDNPCTSPTGVWSQIRNGSGSSANPTSPQDNFFRIYAHNNTWRWSFITRSIFTFNTSSLTNDANISAATLSIRGVSKEDNLSINPNIDIYTSSPVNNNNLVSQDYSSLGTVSQTGSPISYSSFNISGYNDFVFNAIGRGNISKTGISRFGARNQNYDVTGIEPPWTNQVASSLFGYFADNWGITNDPKLIITYTVPVVVPTVTTQSADQIATTSVRGNGNITATGGANCTRRGFCYKAGTSGDPTTSDSVAYDDGSFGTGAFTKSITGLTPNTSYRLRAYAVNSAGTSYGTTVDVKTLSAFIPRTMWFN